jgi:hypothetical protein
LEQRRDHEAKTEHAERADQHRRELGEVAVEFRGIACDGIGIRIGLFPGGPDLALERAQALPFRTGSIGAPGEGIVGRSAAGARQVELLVEEGVGDEGRPCRAIARLDLPIPAGEGQRERGIAKIGRLARIRSAIRCARCDQAGQINVEARIEIALHRLAIERDKKNRRHRDHDEGPCRGRCEEAEGERVKPHRLRPRGGIPGPGRF